MIKFGSSVDEAQGPSLTEGTDSEREKEREKEGCLNSVGTNLPGTVQQGFSCLSGVTTYLPALCCGVQLFKQCRNLTAGHCIAGVQLFNRCRNLSARTVLQGYSFLSGVETYLLALCYSGAAVLSGVETYLWALCCRGAAV